MGISGISLQHLHMHIHSLLLSSVHFGNNTQLCVIIKIYFLLTSDGHFVNITQVYAIIKSFLPSSSLHLATNTRL